MNYKNLLEDKQNIQTQIYLLEFLKKELETKIKEIEEVPNDDITRLGKLYNLYITHISCQEQIRVLQSQEKISESQMYKDLYKQKYGEEKTEKDWRGIVL